ncbi:RmlC-like cupin domain containing protein [Cryptosporidium tyzzeri]|nr:RmlC-like cupin domain containing protein [Cryptosporidium tyzzeri]
MRKKKSSSHLNNENSIVENIERLPSLGKVPEHEGAILMSSEISKSMKRSSSQITDELAISSLLSNAKFTLSVIKIGGNTKTKYEKNTHGFIVVHILSCKADSLIYSLDNKYEFVMSNGSYVHIPPNHFFSFKNLSNESAKISFVVLPKRIREVGGEPAFHHPIVD